MQVISYTLISHACLILFTEFSVTVGPSAGPEVTAGSGSHLGKIINIIIYTSIAWILLNVVG